MINAKCHNKKTEGFAISKNLLCKINFLYFPLMKITGYFYDQIHLGVKFPYYYTN